MTAFMKRFRSLLREDPLVHRGRPVRPGFGRLPLHALAGGASARDPRGNVHAIPIDLAISFFGDVAEVTSFWTDEKPMTSLGLVLRFTSGKFAHLILGSAVAHPESTWKSPAPWTARRPCSL